jgi:hypothetical protein
MATQHKIALKVLEPLLDLKPNHLFVIRGTEAHTGKSSEWEELLAKDLQAEPCDEKHEIYSWFHLLLDTEGVLIDIAHHGKTGYKPWTTGNAVNSMATEIFYRCAERGDRQPNLVIRAHRHKPADSFEHNRHVRVLQIPSWQLSTAFGHRIAPGELLPIGGIAVLCDKGEYEVKKFYQDPPGAKPWRSK